MKKIYSIDEIQELKNKGVEIRYSRKTMLIDFKNFSGYQYVEVPELEMIESIIGDFPTIAELPKTHLFSIQKLVFTYFYCVREKYLSTGNLRLLEGYYIEVVNRVYLPKVEKFKAELNIAPTTDDN